MAERQAHNFDGWLKVPVPPIQMPSFKAMKFEKESNVECFTK